MFHGLTIREYIIANINHDSEYWSLGTGAHYIITYLLKYSDKDWKLLSRDILKWSQEEVEILAISLAYKEHFSQDTDRILRQRFNLFSQIFENFEATEAYDLLDDLVEFLDLDVPELEKDSLQKIQIQFHNIKGLFKQENQSQWFSEIQDKINQRVKTVENKN